MSGKKFGLDEKYKALGVGPRTISINPMQDDLKKLKGMTAAIGAPSKFMQRGLTLRAGADNFTTRSLALRAGVKDASSLLEKEGKSSVKEKIKKFLTSKTNIGATAGAAGYEIGKSEGKKYGGSMKKMASGGMSKKEKKIKKVMGEYKKGELNIGKSKKKVKSRKQAIAIALSEARKKKA